MGNRFLFLISSREKVLVIKPEMQSQSRQMKMASGTKMWPKIDESHES